ncbi:hypothetical protein CBR_g53827 [Chara braunii]|uniref:Uncharacterized protein n=1 Tax=Chara braunii TaxID=69332 RepID=A0A388K720_CHABU|nr:hypothetical protein CBR_g53827 [Chara braunii]|eukprot:GBG65855.1 hypothetical protein CBR_g53827 [Chara braunii]
MDTYMSSRRDTGITNNGRLQLMLNAGLNHIPMRALDEDYAVGELDEALDILLTTRRCHAELSMEEERQVKNVAMEEIRRRIKNYHLRHMHIAEEPINNVAVRKEIEWLTGRYLVCPTDKAPPTPTFVCINFIRRLALERLSGPDFVPLQRPPDEELREKKERKLRAKLQKEAERDAEMEKKMEMRLAARTDDFFNKMEESLGPVLEFAKKAKGKKKIRVLSNDETSAQSSGSETEQLHKKAGKLTISEKRKRGPEPVFEDSPQMITPSKRTPRTKAKEGVAVGRITCSRSKIKTKLSPLIARQKSPGGSEVLAKLQFRNQAIDEIRGLDAQELQLICKNEGVNYNGKIEAIFDIASHYTRVAFGEIEGTTMSESGEREEEDSTTVDAEEPDCDV